MYEVDENGNAIIPEVKKRKKNKKKTDVVGDKQEEAPQEVPA
jgi:hypothetical protein